MRKLFDFDILVDTVWLSNTCVENTQIVVDFGNSGNGRTGVARRRLLIDRNSRRKTGNLVDIRLLHLIKELPRVRRERLNIPTLPFRKNSIERQRGLP